MRSPTPRPKFFNSPVFWDYAFWLEALTLDELLDLGNQLDKELGKRKRLFVEQGGRF